MNNNNQLKKYRIIAVILAVILVILIGLTIIGFIMIKSASDNNSGNTSRVKATEGISQDLDKEENKDSEVVEDNSSVEMPDDESISEIAASSAPVENITDKISENELIDCARKLTSPLEFYEFSMLIDRDEDSFTFDSYEKALMAACAVPDRELLQDNLGPDGFEAVYTVTEKQYENSVDTLFGQGTVTAPLSGANNDFTSVYGPEEGKYCLYCYEGETESDMQVNYEYVSIVDGNTYEYNKEVYFGYWGGDHLASNYRIIYTLKFNQVNPLGAVITDLSFESLDNNAKSGVNPFYGIFISAGKDKESQDAVSAEAYAMLGMRCSVILTSEWDNLNPEPYYAVVYGAYDNESDAKMDLEYVRQYKKDAYVKYTGRYIGGSY